MFARGPPKVYLKLKEGLSAEKTFEGIGGASFTCIGGLTLAMLSGDVARDSSTYLEVVRLLKRHRAGRIVRITVAAAEGVAAAHFGSYVWISSLAQRDRFVVSLKARNRSAEYVIGKTGNVKSKKESASAALDQYA
jgi:hypothetical protein